MSLIDEALKRAREGNDKPQAFTPAPPDPWFYAPLPQRRRPGAALAIGAAAIAPVAAIAFVVSRPRRATAPPDAGTESVAAKTPRAGGGETFPLALAPPTPGSPASLPPRDEGMSSLPSERAGMRPGAAGPAIGIPVVIPRDSRLASASPAIAPSRTLLSSPGAGAHPGEHGRPSAARTYVGSLVAPDGARVELGGIVFSDTNPVALLNGRVLPVGGVVEGMVIVAIEETRVELTGGGATVFLALK